MAANPLSNLLTPMRIGAVAACVLLAPAAAAHADTLIDTGINTYDNQLFASSYFAVGFAATGPAMVDGVSILVNATTSAAVTGSSIDIYGNHPAAPTTPADRLGTLAYASIAADGSRSRIGFTGSVLIPSAGDYWVKWRDLPAGQSARIRMGNPGNPAPWTIRTPAWYLNGVARSELSASYFPMFRITGDTNIPAPAVTSAAPAQGPTTGGTTVVVTGTAFTGASGVYFGGTAAASFTVDSATRITAVTPARAAGTVDVSVTAPGGTTALADAFRFEAAAGGVTVAEEPAAARSRTSAVGALAGRTSRTTGLTTYAGNVRTLQGGRYTILFENARGQRVPLHRGSRVGSRTLRALTYAVVVNARAGQSLPISASLRTAATTGLRIRVIHRDAAGRLSGEDGPLG